MLKRQASDVIDILCLQYDDNGKSFDYRMTEDVLKAYPIDEEFDLGG